jgi:peptidoglycan hydrolase CwlO-like protein
LADQRNRIENAESYTQNLERKRTELNNQAESIQREMTNLATELGQLEAELKVQNLVK